MMDDWKVRSLIREYGDLMFARGLLTGQGQPDGLHALSNRMRSDVEAAITEARTTATYIPFDHTATLTVPPDEEPARETLMDTAKTLEQRLVALEAAVEVGKASAYTLIEELEPCNYNAHGDCADHSCEECEVPLYADEHEAGLCIDCQDEDEPEDVLIPPYRYSMGPTYRG